MFYSITFLYLWVFKPVKTKSKHTKDLISVSMYTSYILSFLSALTCWHPANLASQTGHQSFSVSGGFLLSCSPDYCCTAGTGPRPAVGAEYSPTLCGTVEAQLHLCGTSTVTICSLGMSEISTLSDAKETEQVFQRWQRAGCGRAQHSPSVTEWKPSSLRVDWR